MVSAIVTFSMIFLLLASGRIYEGVRRLITLVFDLIFKIFNFFGIKINKAEQRIHVSRQFKDTFKDIKVVKKSKQNNDLKSSINIFALILLILSITLIIGNLQVVSGNAISIWLYNNNPVPGLIVSQRNMDMTFTAILFSIVTFAISKLINQWKDTKKYRKAKRDILRKEYALKNLSSRELLDAAKLKDLDVYNQLIKQNLDAENLEE